MPNHTGLSPQSPNKYLGPDVYLSTVVTRNRAPTGADYRQPETGKLYPFGTFWLVGKDPTTGTFGDLWYLSKIVANVGYWVLFSVTSYTEGTWTPTMRGSSSSGTTTYTTQVGYYVRIGNLITVQFTLIGTAATGTGFIVIGGLPFAVRNQPNGTATGSILSASGSGFTYLAGTTMMTLGVQSGTEMFIRNSGSGVVGGGMPIANDAFNFQGTVTYEI